VTAQGQPITIYNPYSATIDAAGNATRVPFTGNIIPANLIHPTAKALTAFMPLPNTRTAAVRYATSNFQLPTYAAQDKFYNLILKFDFNFGDNNRGFFRHASNDRTEDRCANGICDGPGQDGQQPFQRINDAYVFDWVTTINPRLIANIRLSNNRFVEKGFGRANEGFDLTKLGLPTSLLSQLPSPVYFGRWNINGYSSLGRSQGINITNNYNVAGGMTQIAGNHTMKYGIDLRRIHFIQQNSGDILSFTGETRWTQRLWNQGEATSGDGYASFLLGGVGGSSNFPVYPFFQQWYFAPYFQDDWKVSRKLSLNLGIRWDLNLAPTEKYNRINRGFNPDIANPIASQISAENLAANPSLRNLKGGLEFAGVNGNPQTVSQTIYRNWQPRIGAAYQLTNRMVLRGGYGLYFLNPNNDYLKTTGFSTNTPLIASLDDNRTLLSNNLLSNPYPNGINQPVGSSRGAATFAGQNYDWFNPRTFTTPYVNQFSLGFQFQINQSSTFEASYVGSRSIDLNSQKDLNIPSASFIKNCDRLQGGNPQFCNELVPNPFRNIDAFRGTTYFTAATISRYNLNRPFPQFSGNLLEQGRNDSRIWYNSLQLNYNVRMGRNLTVLANYTLSKMVERWGYADPFNNVSQQGLYFNDRPHWAKFSAVYELPFGRGQKFANGAGGVMNKLIGGWQLSTFSNVSSGEPNDLPGNAIQLRDPRTPGGDYSGQVEWKKYQVQGWNPCVLRQFNDGSIAPQPFSLARGCGTDTSQYAWMMVADFSPGQAVPGRQNPNRSGQIRKQPLFNMDASLSKWTNITERIKTQFRLEAFNLTNYYFYGRNDGFNTDPNNPNFGTVFPHLGNTQNGYPRQIQLGFKILW